LEFNSEGLIVGTSSILASELPIADASNVGAVSIGSNSGLSVSNAGALTLSNTYSGTSSINGLVINSFGQITSTSQITGSDINIASTSNLGVIKVASGGPFSVNTAGEISLANSGATAGTYTSVTVDALGRVTAASQMTDAQLPDHSAAKITSGTLSADRLSNSSINGEKLSDASVTLFGGPSSTSNVVTFPATGNFKGQYFWDELNADLYLYTGSSWVPVTISSGEILFGGLYSGATNTVSTVSSAGSAAGLTVGSGLPPATAANERLYVVVDSTGTGSAPAPAVTLNPPDYIISDGSSWEMLDVSGAIAATTAGNVGVSAVAPDISTNVQQSLENLQTNKLNKSGGDISGTVRFTSTGVLQFEGSEDEFETTLGVVNPTTSDKSILLPDESGILITSASTGSITSSMLSNDITNSNIASNCSLSFTKLEALNSGNILVGNSSNEAASVAMTGDVGINNAGLTTIQAGSIVNSMIDSSAAISASKIQSGSTSNAGVLQLVDSTSSTSTSLAGTANSVKSCFDLATQADTTASAAAAKSGDTFSGNVIIGNAREIRFTELSPGSNYISFKAPDAITSDISLIWPSTAPAAGQILKANASNANQLEWSSDAIDVAAANLTGSTLASNVTASSLTSVGTLGSLNVSGTITGSLTGDVTGNADTATTLATARSINGSSFNGSADITVTAEAGTLTGTTLNSTVVTSSLTALGTLTDLTVTNTITGSISGNAGTATTLATARTLGGVSFNGSADIDLPGVNTAGSQNTSGTAALATEFTVTANNVNETVYPVFVDGSSSNQGAEVDTGLTYNPSTGLLTSAAFAGALTGNCSGTSGGFTAGDASNLNAGTLPDARFPSTLPTADGSNLTNLDLADTTNTGTIPAARLGSGSSNSKFLRGDNTWQTISAGGVTSVTGTAPIVSSGTATPAISITAASASAAGSMSSAHFSKLEGIAAGAEANVNANWDSSSGDSQILNKPTIIELLDEDDMASNSATKAPSQQSVKAFSSDATNLTSGTIDQARFSSAATSAVGVRKIGVGTSVPNVSGYSNGDLFIVHAA